MPYDMSNNPLRRVSTLGTVGNPDTRADSVKHRYENATADTAAVVEAANYFNADTRLQRGDLIDMSMNNVVAATPVRKHYVVTQGKASGDANNVIALQTTTAG